MVIVDPDSDPNQYPAIPAMRNDEKVKIIITKFIVNKLNLSVKDSFALLLLHSPDPSGLT